MILVYKQNYELEREVETLGELESDWFVSIKELEDALKSGSIVNHRYLIPAEDLPKRLGSIIKEQENKIIDLFGGNLDDSDAQIDQLSRELDSVKTSEVFYKQKLDSTLLTLDIKLEELGTVKDELVVANTKIEAQESLIKNAEVKLEDSISTQIDTKLKLDVAVQGLNDVIAIIDGKPTSKDIEEAKVNKNKSKNKVSVKEVESKPQLDEVVVRESKKESTKAKEEHTIKSTVSESKVSVKEDAKNTQTSTHKGLDWIGKLSSKDFPLKGKISKKQNWHALDVANELSSPKNVVTEADLDYIVNTTFKNLNYRKDKANPKIFSSVEVILLVFAVNASLDKKVSGLAKLELAVNVLYSDWQRNRADIESWLAKN